MEVLAPPARSESEEDIIMGLSVAEKRSLFMQMEQEAARSRNQRLNRASSFAGGGGGGGRLRFVTQPVTTEEVKAAQALSGPATVAPVMNGGAKDSQKPKKNTHQHQGPAARRPTMLIKVLEEQEEDGSGDAAFTRGRRAPASLPLLPRRPSITLKDRVTMFNQLSTTPSESAADKYKYPCRRAVVSRRFATTPVSASASCCTFVSDSDEGAAVQDEDAKQKHEENKICNKQKRSRQGQAAGEQVEQDKNANSNANNQKIDTDSTDTDSLAPAVAEEAFEVQGLNSLHEPEPEPQNPKTQNVEDSSSSSNMVHISSCESGRADASASARPAQAKVQEDSLISGEDMGNSKSSSSSSCLPLSSSSNAKRRSSDCPDKPLETNNNNRIVSFVKKQLLSRSSSCNFPKMETREPLEIPYDDPAADGGGAGDSPGSGSTGSGRSNRIKEKIAALKTNGELGWMKRVPGKRVGDPDGENRAPATPSPPSSPDENGNGNEESKNNKIAARLSLLEKSQDGWRNRVSESDATAFTVQGRLERAGKLTARNNKNLEAPTPPAAAPGGGGDAPAAKKLSPGTGRLMFSKSQHELSACLLKHQKSPRAAHLGAGDSTAVDGVLKKSPTFASSSEPSLLRSISVTPNDNETFSKFWTTAEAATSVQIDDASFTAAAAAPRQMLGVRRNVKPLRNHAASRNPVRALAERAAAAGDQSYLEVAPEVREKEAKRKAQMESLAKSSPLSVEALAGLASKEDFATVKLRTAAGAKTAAGAPGAFPHPMLLQIKGKRYVQTRLVAPIASSVNSGDCFVLVTDGGETVYQYIGEFSNRMERSKLADIVAHLTQRRDLGVGPSSVVHTLEEPWSTSRMQAFLASLGGAGGVATEEALGDEHDELYELGVIKTNRVYGVDVDSEELIAPPAAGAGAGWGSQPRHAMLTEDAVLVFDFASELYVWSGSKADPKLKRLGARLGKKLFDEGYANEDATKFSPLPGSRGRPSWCWFKRVVQFMEPILFREKFFDWPDEGRFSKNVKTGATPSSPGSAAAAAIEGFNFKAPNPKAMEEAWLALEDAGLELQGFNVGRGNMVTDKEHLGRTHLISTEAVQAWHCVSDPASRVPVPPAQLGHFNSSETYVIRWQYRVTTTGRDLKGGLSKQAGVRGRERTAYFFWHGQGSSITDKGTSALMTVELDEEKGPQIRVAQGAEQPAFLRLFGGRMWTHQGAARPGGSRLYVAMGCTEQEGHFLQVPCCNPEAFRSRSSFLFLVDTRIYLWHGASSSSVSRAIAIAGAKYLSSTEAQETMPQYVGLEVVEVEEGKEPKPFLKDLGVGDLVKWRESYGGGSTPEELQVFRFSTLSGSFEAEPVPSVGRKAGLYDPFPVLQEELYGSQQPSLFLISTPTHTWLWQGWLPSTPEDDENKATGSLCYRWAAERKAAIETAIAYATHRHTGAPDAAEGWLVQAGSEPPQFKALFPCWRADLCEEARLGKNPPLGLTEALRPFLKSSYTLEELTARERPEGVDVLKLEAYLSDEDFEKLLKMSREEFGGLQAWKKAELKKQAGLF